MYRLPNADTLADVSGWKRDIFADYSGSDRKTGLIGPDGTRYLVKYAESHTRKNDLDTSYVNNILNEHLGSRILGILGYPVHDTFLATHNGDLVVCCRNFTSEEEKLIEFGQFLKAHYDSGELGRVPDLQQMKAVRARVPAIREKLPDIRAFIRNERYLSDIRKEFYARIIEIRFHYLLQPAYEKCFARSYDRQAYDRLASGAKYTEQMFEARADEFLEQKDPHNNRLEILDAKYGDILAKAETPCDVCSPDKE